MVINTFDLEIAVSGGEPYRLALRPLTTLSAVAAQQAASRRVQELEDNWSEIKAFIELPDHGPIDLSVPTERDAVYQAFRMEELAARHVASWNLTDAQGEPLPVTRENILIFSRMPPVGQLVWNMLHMKAAEHISEKKAFGVAPSGTMAQAPHTASDVKSKTFAAAKV